MLARVLKNTAIADFAAFAAPEIGAGNLSSKKLNAFIVPDFNEFKIVKDTREESTNQNDGHKTAAPNIEEILQQARNEAAQIIAQAEADSQNIHEAVREKVEQEVKLNFEAEVSERVAEVRASLAKTIEEISSLADRITNLVEPQLVELALKIAKKIVGREVTIDREIALTLVKVSLGKLHNRSIAEVHLNPEDFNFVQTHREKLDFRGSLELVEDKSVSVGGCLIHTETGDIDARVESQFDEISHGLFN